ncbi:MAG: hypothetical protein K2N35_17610 [Muribaculaceae bacterium]|nr:hypothetical protein [Muribaculaceae bacterium]
MKTLRYIFVFSLLLSIKTYASGEVPDTLMAVDSPSKVIITESSQGTRIIVTDNKSGTEESYLVEYTPGAKVSTSRKSSVSIFNIPGLDCMNRKEKCGCIGNGWSVGADGLCIGLNQAHDQTGGGGLQWSKSFEISWLSCLNIGYSFSRSHIYLGLGFDWRNYKATADRRWLVVSESGGVEWGEAPEGANVRYSRLKVFSLQMPLLYEWSIPKSKLQLKLGPILNFNTYSSLKGIYDDSFGNRCECFTKNFERNPTTLDFFGSIAYRNSLGIYVRYSPMKVLKESSPINFTPFTVGIGFLI